MNSADFKQELGKLSIKERTGKSGKVYYYVADENGIISSVLHEELFRAEQALRKVASHITYKKNILMFQPGKSQAK